MEGERLFYNTMSLHDVIKALQGKDKQRFHPMTVEWAINENYKFAVTLRGGSSLDALVIPFASKDSTGRWKVDQQQFDRRMETGTYGIADKTTYAAFAETQGIPHTVLQDPLTIARSFENTLTELVTAWKTHYDTWEHRERWQAPFTGTMEDAEALIQNVAMRFVGSLDDLRIKWDTSSWPVSPAVYQPHRTTLCLHQWVVEKGRICDIIILALHEVVGHYYQEKNTYTTSAQAENCAMMCEALVNKVMGSPCCAIEWKIMRYCRALLDLRMHTHVMEGTYKLPENVWDVWSKKINNALQFIVPLPSETLRVAALPGQALTYCIRVPKSTNGCHALCVSAAQ